MGRRSGVLKRYRLQSIGGNIGVFDINKP